MVRLEPSLLNLIMNHGLVTVIGFILLTILSLAAAFLYLIFRKCRNSAGQTLLFLYSLSLAVFCMLMLFGFYHPPLSLASSFSHSTLHISCVAVSVSTHVFILLSFGIVACYGVHLVYRVRAPGILPNLFVVKSVLPTTGISIALPIALAVVRPHDYIDDFASCFPRDLSANFAIFLPMALVLLTNFIILTTFPYFYAPNTLPRCCRQQDEEKLDWSPVYTPWSPSSNGLHQHDCSNQAQAYQHEPVIVTDFAMPPSRPTCLHALAILGIGFLESGLLIMFYLSNFTPSLRSSDPHAPPSTNPESRSYHISFLVMAFLLGISLVLIMATLEDESLNAFKSFCLGNDPLSTASRDDSRPDDSSQQLAADQCNNGTSQVAGDGSVPTGGADEVVDPRHSQLTILPPLQRNAPFSLSSPQLNAELIERDAGLTMFGVNASASKSSTMAFPQVISTSTTLPRRRSRPEDIYDNLPDPALPPRPPRSAFRVTSTSGGKYPGYSQQVTFEDELPSRNLFYHTQQPHRAQSQHQQGSYFTVNANTGRYLAPSLEQTQPTFIRCTNCAMPITTACPQQQQQQFYYNSLGALNATTCMNSLKLYDDIGATDIDDPTNGHNCSCSATPSYYPTPAMTQTATTFGYPQQPISMPFNHSYYSTIAASSPGIHLLTNQQQNQTHLHHHQQHQPQQQQQRSSHQQIDQYWSREKITHA